MVLCIEHFLYVFYTFQIIRLIVSDDMALLAKKIFEFMSVKFILGTAIKIIDFAHGAVRSLLILDYWEIKNENDAFMK